MKHTKKNPKTQKQPVKVHDLAPEKDPRGGYEPAFFGGVRVATGDVNNDNLVVSPKPGKITN